jgi:hypothetical protein
LPKAEFSTAKNIGTDRGLIDDSQDEVSGGSERPSTLSFSFIVSFESLDGQAARYNFIQDATNFHW